MGQSIKRKVTPFIEKGSITIDGVMDEKYWTNFSPLPYGITDNIDCQNIDNTPVPKSHSASFSTLWDEELLYVAVDVKDLLIQEKDEVVLYFSMQNDRTSNCPGNWPRAYDVSHFKLF
jgi:hypothetical protein